MRCESLGRYLYVALGTTFVFGNAIVGRRDRLRRSRLHHDVCVLGSHRIAHRSIVDVPCSDGTDGPPIRIMVVNLHLEHGREVERCELRRLQVQILLQWVWKGIGDVESCGGGDGDIAGIIIAGDFNAFPDEPGANNVT